MTSVLEPAAPALCKGSSGVSLEFEGCLHEKFGVTPSRFSTSWNIHPQVPGSLASSKFIPQYLEPMWWQFSAWVQSVRADGLGTVSRKRPYIVGSHPEWFLHSNFCLLQVAQGCAFNVSKIFCPEFVFVIGGEVFSDTSYSVLIKSQNSTSECFGKEKNDEVSLVLVHIKVMIKIQQSKHCGTCVRVYQSQKSPCYTLKFSM